MNRREMQRERWAALFLARLERLCHLEERFVSPPTVLGDPQRLVHKAIFATYCDCVVLGHKAEAERLLAGAPARPGPADSSPPRQVDPTH